MSAPIKPKAGGVNLFLTRGEFETLENCVKFTRFMGPKAGAEYRAFSDLLTVIQSQSKESSNDS